jgi:hypothetical protein
LSNSSHAHILNAFHQCKTALSIYLDLSIDKALLEILISAIQRGLAVDLILSEDCAQKIVQNPFLLKNLFELRTKGLNIFHSSSTALSDGKEYIVQTDFKNTFILKSDLKTEEISNTPFASFFDAITAHEKNRFHPDDADISVTFAADNQTLFKNSTTTINWEVDNAEEVKISGMGEVEIKATKNIQVLEDTILTLTASNKKQQFKKAIFLKTINNIEIRYDIKFLNPASKKFVSLKTNEDTEGVFGISKGQKVKLIWEVLNAEEVLIAPFNLNKKSGAHVFRPGGSLEINIKASLQGKTTTERIIIHEYPMPVFTHHLIDIKEDFVSRSEFQYQNYRDKAYHFIEQKGLLNNDKINEQIKAKIKNQEKDLMGLYDQITFNDFYKEHSVKRMNDSILGRLRFYFKEKPQVLKMIDLLHRHDHE